MVQMSEDGSHPRALPINVLIDAACLADLLQHCVIIFVNKHLQSLVSSLDGIDPRKKKNVNKG